MRFFCFVCLMLSSFAYGNVHQKSSEQIDHIYKESNFHSHADFLSLEIVRNRSELKKLLRQIIANQSGELEQVSGYFHPVGFVKMTLYVGSKGQKLRLHFWGQKLMDGAYKEITGGWEPIHNHRWNFSSIVLSGGLHVREYEVPFCGRKFETIEEAKVYHQKVENPLQYNLYSIYAVPAKASVSTFEIEPVNRYQLIGGCYTYDLMQGEHYYTPHNRPHQVLPDPHTATLLLLDPPSKPKASQIFVPDEKAFISQLEPIELSQSEVKDQLIYFLDTI